MPKLERRGESWLDEVLAVLFFVLSLFLLSSFLSFKLGNTNLRFDLLGDTESEIRKNLMGPVGHVTGTLLSGVLGWCSLVAVLWAAWFGVYFWNFENAKKDKEPGTVWSVLLGFSGMLVFSCALVATLAGNRAGGSLGDLVSSPLKHLFGALGASILSGLFFLVSVALATRTTIAFTAASFVLALAKVIHLTLVTIPLTAFYILTYLLGALWGGVVLLYLTLTRHNRSDQEDDLPRPRLRKNRVEPFVLGPKKKEIENPALANQANERVFNVIVNRRKPAVADEKADKKSVVKETKKVEEPRAQYVFPPLSLLTRGEVSEVEDDEELRQKSLLIESKLRDFNILGRVTHVHPGPVITLFEFEPAAGVKVGKIAALQDDLAMGLRATSIRIIAPIPRRGTVGIEVPNKHRDIVRLRDVLESEVFQNAESTLCIPLGKDTSGDPVVSDISTMPHLLMAGATGTGKSVCINALLLSLLYRCSPAELGLILIDPKILELSVYADIPHLRVPVVVDPRSARAVLQWAVNEMNRRYRVMQKYGVRSIDGYNKIVSGEISPEELREKGEKDLIPLSEEIVVEEADQIDAASGEDQEQAESEFVEELKPLPKILIVIDELADLMFSAGREIEELITRLAQKARASGIHLIVATQRPSVDVITGLIKANFPARLSFRVSSKIDSRTILDANGAEKLLGRGDILFMQPGAEWLRRLHGAYVSDSEVKRVVEAVKRNGKPYYDEHIMTLCEKALQEEAQDNRDSEGGGEEEYDPLYDKAVELVVDKGQASTSMIQRVFRIGYNRAARMIEVMEREGVIGPMDGVKPREVLLPNQIPKD